MTSTTATRTGWLRGRCLTVGPDEVLIVRYPARIPDDDWYEMAEILQGMLDDRWLIIDQGADVAKLFLPTRSADGVRAEQEDAPERDGDGKQQDVLGSEAHVFRLPPRTDG